MSDAQRNKIAAQIIKAEMLGDEEKIAVLKVELANLPSESTSKVKQDRQPKEDQRNCNQQIYKDNRGIKSNRNDRVKKFIESTSSLNSMFVQEKKYSTSDESRMYMKTAAKFTRDDMETKFFSEEIDDSQVILNKSKRHKTESSTNNRERFEGVEVDKPCERCPERQPQHLMIEDNFRCVYLSLTESKPFLSSLSHVIIRNNDHSSSSFVSSSEKHQIEVEEAISRLSKVWKTKGYGCLAMEMHFRNRRPASREIASCGKHFQIHCLPLREKYIEKARMCFKQSLQSTESERSLNKRLIQTADKRIQRYLPVGLSYFWVCFDDLKRAFGCVIESENDFSRFFGFEVLAGMLDKEFNPSKLCQYEKFTDQFNRCRDFKLMYSSAS